MARADSRALLRLVYLSHLDGAWPSVTRGWAIAVAPVVVQAAAGAGHWAAGRGQRALAEWAGAAGFGLVAWGLGTEAPAAAEVEESIQRLLKGPDAQAWHQGPGYGRDGNTRGSPGIAVLPLVRRCFPGSVSGPQRAVMAAPPVAGDGARDRQGSPNTVFYVLRAARAVQRRRPRTAVGSALVAAGSLARLWAASNS